MRLGGDVETGRGLVQHDDLGPAGERHGQGHALLLAAGELVRVAPQELLVARQQHLGHHLGDARLALLVALAEVVHLEDLAQLQADAQRGVERRAGVLRHVADHAAAQLPQLPGAQREHVLVVDGDAAAADLGAAALEVEQRRGGRGLARGRLADEAQDLALDELEVDLVVDLDARGVERDLEVLDGEDDPAHLTPPCPARCRSWREPRRRWPG